MITPAAVEIARILLTFEISEREQADTALANYKAALVRGDLAEAERHRQVYLEIYPSAFADLMQSTLEVTK